MAGRIALKDKNKSLTSLSAANAQIEADAKTCAVAATMKAVQGINPKVLQTLMAG